MIIEFNETAYKIKQFNYSSGRKGILLSEVNNSNVYFAGSLDMSNVPIKSNEIIVKSHDLNSGLLNCLIDHNFIARQFKVLLLGYNKVYLCKLL